MSDLKPTTPEERASWGLNVSRVIEASGVPWGWGIIITRLIADHERLTAELLAARAVITKAAKIPFEEDDVVRESRAYLARYDEPEAEKKGGE